MVSKRYNEWERDFETYSPNQIEAIAEFCGIELDGETNTHFLGYCPFHNNTDSPAFAIDKYKGLWTCFNPSCDNSGTLQSLLYRIRHVGPFEARRIILKYQHATTKTASERLAAVMEKRPEFIEFPSEPVERMQADFWKYDTPLDYMQNRGFTEETIRHFGVGYSAKRDMTIVPMHDPNGMLIGFIGRSIKDKVFKNSDNLPKSKTAWNLHRAKKHGDTLIVCESSFDAMRIHQSGYPNVVALLGGHFSEHQKALLNKTSSKIIVMTDFDQRGRPKPNCRRCAERPAGPDGVRCIGHRPGRDLGWSISQQLPNKRIMWAAYDDSCVYPHGAKDAGDMTDDEIRQCLKNAVSNFEYTRWAIEDADLLVA